MCAQIEIGGHNAKTHIQGMFIVSEPLNKQHMVKVVQHLFGKDVTLATRCLTCGIVRLLEKSGNNEEKMCFQKKRYGAK